MNDQYTEVLARPSRPKLLFAYSVIYFVWGSTYYAIRVGVLDVPPFLFAGMRFAFAGLFLFAWQACQGVALPGLREWRSIAILASLLFAVDYGLLFWAEQRVSSGIAATMLATIPVFMALFEILLLQTRKLSLRLVSSLFLGVGGVSTLCSQSVRLGDRPIDVRGASALVVASVTWSFGSVLSRKLVLPQSKSLSAGSQMLLGGLLLGVVAAATGEFRGFSISSVPRTAWIALVYLVFAGSILGFTAYLWLLHHDSPTKVGTYAYVNPVVAVLLGWCVAGERMTLRLVLGLLLIVVSVLLITFERSPAALIRQSSRRS